MRVLLAGGGTAGHTSPLLATADALRRLDAGRRDHLPRHAAGPRDPGRARGRLPARADPAGAAARAGPTPTCSGSRPAARRGQARRSTILDRVRPDVVVGYGGYVSMPAYLAARRGRVPLVVHEENALPGLANKVGARFDRPRRGELPRHRRCRTRQYVGLPIRRMISTLDRAAPARRGPRALRPRPRPARRWWSPAARRARAASTRRSPARPRPSPRPASRCCTCRARTARPSPRPRTRRTSCVDFVDRMDLAYAAADLVVCRAGANTVTEAAAVGLPAVFVPLPIGNGEQALNAQPVVDAGGGSWSPTPTSPPTGSRAHVPGLAHRPRPAGARWAPPRPG